MSRVDQSKLSPLEDLCPSLDSTTLMMASAADTGRGGPTPLGGRCVRLSCVWSPALQAGPVLMLQLEPHEHQESRALPWAERASRGCSGGSGSWLSLSDHDLGVELDPHIGYVRS